MASMISSSSNTSLPPSWNSESDSTSTFRDVSFSSYLNGTEEAYIRTLAQSGQGLRLSSSESPRLHDSRKKKADDGEIDVFGAEKYFNGGVLEPKSNKGANSHGSRKYQHQEQEHIRLKVKQPRTPSSSSHSESSWNSQSALLRRVPSKNLPSRGVSGGYNSGNNGNDNGVKAQGRKSLFLPCYCCDNSAIDINEKAEFMQNTRNTDPKFVFPVVSKAPLSKGGLIETVDEDDEIGRKSLEVFGSGELDMDGIGGSKSFSLERRLSMLSWDAIPRQLTSEEELLTANNPSSGVPPSESYDDTGSEASSDLFEIECLSCTANPTVQVGAGPRPTADPDPDPDPCPTPTTCYAPSEVSIEWSVVTASAADFSSTISDSEDHPRPTTRRAPEPKRAPTRPGGILLGCKSQKAVRVAGEVHRPLMSSSTNKKGNNYYKGSTTHENNKKTMMMQKSKYRETKLGGLAPISMSRFQAEAKVIGGLGGHKQSQQHVIPSPRWSHSSHGSEIMYIQ